MRPSDGELPDGSTPGTVATELDYDERGNVTVQREAAGTTLERETLFEYEPVFNQVKKITDPGGFPTTFDLDANGNVLKTSDALKNFEEFTYNAQGECHVAAKSLIRLPQNRKKCRISHDCRIRLYKYTLSNLIVCPNLPFDF